MHYSSWQIYKKIMKVYLTEQQINDISTFLAEGIEYTPNGDSVNVRVINSPYDKSNQGLDSRVFGNKRNILYGDETSRWNSVNFSTKVEQREAYVNILTSLIDFIKNGRRDEINVDSINLNPVTKKTLLQKLQTLPDDEFITWAEGTLDRLSSEYDVIQGKYNRISNAKEGEIQERYHKGVVPGSDITLIALFDIADFNVSDAMKHAEMRQGPLTDKIFKINKDDREEEKKVFGGKAALKKIPVTYDNGIASSVDSNFSLDASVGPEHLGRKKYRYGDEGYTSVAEFLDKSISYAARVLREENRMPQFIVAAPSSSKYNDFYCQRLSQKLGTAYVKDFFARNIINVVFDRDGMVRSGTFSDDDINKVSETVKKAVMGEIVSALRAPVTNFVQRNGEILSNVRLKKGSRSFLTEKELVTVILSSVYDELEKIVFSPNSVINDNVSRVILNKIVDKKSKYMDINYVKSMINAAIKKYCQEDFTQMLRTVAWGVASYHDKLLENGVPLNFESKAFKITSLDKRFRQFVKNAYVIADKELNRDGELFSRYRGANFVLFDEDMNSGATLRILADAMNDKGIENEQITCLVNAYSPGGY